MNQWSANIRKFYYLRLFTVFSFTNPILIIYMLEKGLTFGTILLLSGIQRIFGILIEVPTGALSDLKGHKCNLQLGTFSFAVSCLIFAFSNTFWGFFLAEIFMALSAGFISGADTAFVFESLERYHAEESYEKVFGRMKAIQSFVSAVVMLGIGFLAEISWLLPFFFGAFCGLVSFAIACTFVEPATLVRLEKGKGIRTYQNYCSTIGNAIKISFTNVQLRWFLVYTSILGVGLLLTEDFYQIYMKEGLGIPVAYLGVIYALLYVGQAFFSTLTGRGLQTFGFEGMFYVMPLLGLVTVAGMIFFNHYIVVALFMFQYIAVGLSPTVSSGYLNRRTAHGQRATVNSLRMLMRKLSYAIFSPVVGWIFDTFGQRQALTAAAGFLLLALGLPLLYKQRYQIDFESCHVEPHGTSAK